VKLRGNGMNQRVSGFINVLAEKGASTGSNSNGKFRIAYPIKLPQIELYWIMAWMCE
jgi:hypothetical protein